MIDERHRKILQCLWASGPASRWELHERTGLSANRVGLVAESLIRARLIRAGVPQSQPAGRPRVPLEIDPAGRHLIGLALAPGGFTLCRLTLGGELIERVATPTAVDPARLIATAAARLRKTVNPQTLSVGVTVTGFIDAVRRSVRFSSALPNQAAGSLKPIETAAGKRPVVFGNDMHALAARWAMLHRAERAEDVLLVWFTDGRFGAAVLVEGRPNRGCFAGGNELGHVRFFVDTDRCFCGAVGCLERIVSTDFLRRQDKLDRTRPRGASIRSGVLRDRIGRFDHTDRPLEIMLQHLCAGLSNAVNFLRPHRLVLVSPLIPSGNFSNAVIRGTHALLLPPLRDAVSLEFWNQSAAEADENAGWLAIAEFLWTGWDAMRGDRRGVEATAASAQASFSV